MITFNRLYYAGTIDIDPATVLAVVPDNDNTACRINLPDGVFARVIGSEQEVLEKLAANQTKIPLDKADDV
jgi:hypothetical protein